MCFRGSVVSIGVARCQLLAFIVNALNRGNLIFNWIVTFITLPFLILRFLFIVRHGFAVLSISVAKRCV